MAQPYDSLFDSLLNMTALVHIPVKLFTIYVVLRHTPHPMRYSSYFMLNTLLWNFLGNLVLSLMHPYPMYPALCLRFEGVLSALSFADNEIFAHGMFLLLFICILNCVLAQACLVTYRYLIFKWMHYLRPYRSLSVIALIHGGAMITTLIFYYRLMVLKSDYPLQSELPEDTRFLFCFKPFGPEKQLAAYGFLAVVLGSISSSFLFGLLLLRSIRKEEGKMEKLKLENHKKILWTIIVVSVVPVCFGALPLVLAIYTLVYTHAPFAAPTFKICVVIVGNHGTMLAVVLILSLKSYREAARGIFRMVVCFGKVTGVAPNALFVRSTK
uniref:G_PROTEIN_RECEP_F1_2 domain-containing protein n=1 Tax=Steinernema glaseri TaxID=37863 RepID=A0A1I7Y099_9BILA